MKKALSILLYALLAVCVVMLVMVFVLPDNEGVGLILSWTYILLGLAILSAIIFPLINLVKNPKAAVRSLIGLGVVIVVVGIALALSSTEPVTLPGNKVFDDPTGLLVTDAGLYTAYVALIAAILVTIFGGIRNSFK